MDDPQLRIRLMHSAAIVSDFVAGIQGCNYEFYLRELLNNSSYFVERGGSLFSAPESENHGQCDAIARNYELDFKILASRTEMQAASILKSQPVVLMNGITLFTECKKPGGRIKATRIHAALRGLSVRKLEAIRSAEKEEDSVYKDIAHVLVTAEVKKNLLFFFPYELWFDQSIQHDNAIETIEKSLSEDFNNLFLYRASRVPDFDTYLTVKYIDEFFVFQSGVNRLTFLESIPISKMPTYITLARYNDRWC